MPKKKKQAAAIGDKAEGDKLIELMLNEMRQTGVKNLEDFDCGAGLMYAVLTSYMLKELRLDQNDMRKVEDLTVFAIKRATQIYKSEITKK